MLAGHRNLILPPYKLFLFYDLIKIFGLPKFPSFFPRAVQSPLAVEAKVWIIRFQEHIHHCLL